MQELVQYGAYLVGLLIGLWMLIAGTRNLRAAVAVVCVMAFFSSIASQVETGVSANRTWLYPLQDQRAQLYLVISCVLTVIMASNTRHLRLDRFPVVAGLMLMINVFAGVLDTRDDPADGAMRIGLAILSLGTLAAYVPAMIRGWDDFLPLMRALGMAGVIWVGGSMVQAVLDKSQLLMGTASRFTGLAGNPQGAAVYLGPQSAIILWLMLNDTSRRMRFLWAGVYAVILMMVAWTGSRTGVLLALIGAMFLLRARIGRAVFLLPVLALALVGVGYLVGSLGIELPFDRLTSGEDTRSAAWRGLLDDALHSGLFGGGARGARFVENSFLLGWARYGPIMAILLVVQALAMGISGLKLWRVRGLLPTRVKGLVDLTIAYYLIYLAGAQFEGIIIARIDPNLCYIVIFSCVSLCMQGIARDGGGVEADHEHDSTDWSYGELGPDQPATES